MTARLLTFVTLALTVCVPVIAQDTPNSQASDAFRHLIESEAGSTAASTSDADLHELVEKVLLIQLRKAVDLSDDQLQSLGRRIGSFKDQLTRIKFQHGAAREQLRDYLDEGISEEQIRIKLEELLGYEKSIAEVLRQMIRAASTDLTVVQAAQLYLFVDDFGDFMTDMVSRAQYASRHGSTPSASPTGPASGSQEETVVNELVRRESLGPTGRTAEDNDMAALFDGVLMVQMSQALKLDPEETIRLFHRVGTYKDQLHELKWQLGEARSALRGAITRGAPDTKIQSILDDQLLREEAVAELIRVFVLEAQKDVSISNSARLYLFVGDFEEYVIRLLQRASKM